MKVLLETKERSEVIKWMVSVLTDKYEEYTSLFECCNEEMKDFLNYCIKETLCDHCVHLGSGFVENIGNILCNYIFCINCERVKKRVHIKSFTMRMARSMSVLLMDGLIGHCGVIMMYA